MPDLRQLAESDLKHTLEGDWSATVSLLSPDGVWQRGIRGQVRTDIVRLNPDTGERVVVPTPVVTLRRSSLTRVPVAGENWLVECPTGPLPTSPVGQFVFSPTRPPEGGASLGIIRLYLQQVEQGAEPPPEDEQA